MNTLIDYIINIVITIGSVGGILYVYTILRDMWWEHRWHQQFSEDELRNILRRLEE